MSKYKIAKDRQKYFCWAEGDTQFRPVTAASVPQYVKEYLANNEPGVVHDTVIASIPSVFTVPFETASPEPARPERNCLFCGEQGTRSKFVYLQMVYLCENDYHNKTTGEVGQKIKELSSAQA